LDFFRIRCGSRWRIAFRGTAILAVLEGGCKSVGLRAKIRVDQGGEFMSRDRDR